MHCQTMAITWTITDQVLGCHITSTAHNGVALFHTGTLSDILWYYIHVHDVLLCEKYKLSYDESDLYLKPQGMLT